MHCIIFPYILYGSNVEFGAAGAWRTCATYASRGVTGVSRAVSHVINSALRQVASLLHDTATLCIIAFREALDCLANTALSAFDFGDVGDPSISPAVPPTFHPFTHPVTSRVVYHCQSGRF